jgi:hypothetical protein
MRRERAVQLLLALRMLTPEIKTKHGGSECQKPDHVLLEASEFDRSILETRQYCECVRETMKEITTSAFACACVSGL